MEFICQTHRKLYVNLMILGGLAPTPTIYTVVAYKHSKIGVVVTGNTNISRVVPAKPWSETSI